MIVQQLSELVHAQIEPAFSIHPGGLDDERVISAHFKGTDALALE